MSDVSSSGHAIETLQVEEHRYRPDHSFSKQANAQPDIYGKGLDDFWTAESKRITFFEPWTKLYEWKPPYAKWFLGGKLNVCFNCVDRHVEGGLKDKVAFFWEGEPEDDRREITFGQRQKDVVRFANALKKLGVKRGTHVGIYMGMIPELPVAMLACARIGAPFTVVFGGFSGESLSGRMNDMECELLITQDEGWRRGSRVPLKANADAAMENAPTVKRCAADIGWVTGHSYIVFGPLANGTTGIVYEGTPDFPDKDRWWKIVERYKPDILYTAPTTIRTHMKWGPEFAAKHDLSSLRVLGTVGEPINPEAWVWYREHIGGNRTPVVDTWWQTETGMILITPLPGLTTLKPGSATQPFPTVDAAVYNNAGETVPPGGGGYLVIRKPWPAMLRGIYGDPERYQQTYWSRWKDTYFVGDGARVG